MGLGSFWIVRSRLREIEDPLLQAPSISLHPFSCLSLPASKDRPSCRADPRFRPWLRFYLSFRRPLSFLYLPCALTFRRLMHMFSHLPRWCSFRRLLMTLIPLAGHLSVRSFECARVPRSAFSCTSPLVFLVESGFRTPCLPLFPFVPSVCICPL